jgi:hypothetical protein
VYGILKGCPIIHVVKYGIKTMRNVTFAIMTGVII